MNPLLTNLSESLNNKDEEEIVESLRAIVSQGKNIELSNLSPIEPLFHYQENTEILKLTADALAECAKTDVNRKMLTTTQVTSFLLNLFKFADNSLTVQACRALGNICFENEAARKLIGVDGLKTLLGAVKLANESHDLKLQTVACGFMLNLLMGDEELQKATLEEEDTLMTIEEILRRNFKTQEDCSTHLLLTLNMLAEQMNDKWLSESLCCLLVDVLKVSINSEISVITLEIIHGQLENDVTKLFLAKKGICELVFDLIEKYKHRVDDEESRAALKMACEIIVLVLTGDEPMDLLYNNGEGVTFNNMVSWMSSDDPDLISAGVLAIGNFARNDKHCVEMVQNGIAKRLLDLLIKTNTSEKDVKVQYAILSALRNLVILPQNKEQILQEGLVDVLYPMLNIDHSHVVFQLLGTFRIVINGQEKTALDLAMRQDFLQKISDWCYNSDHLGVRGEAPRLLAWLIKHSHSTRPYRGILSAKNCVKCLVDMIASNHSVMQNEAFYALTLLSKSCLDGGPTNKNNDNNSASNDTEFDRLVVEAEIGKKFDFLITKYIEKLEQETISNLLTLLEQLVVSHYVCAHLRDSELSKILVKLKEKVRESDLEEKIERLSNTIDCEKKPLKQHILLLNIERMPNKKLFGIKNYNLLQNILPLDGYSYL